MKPVTKRVLFASLVSISGIAALSIWYFRGFTHDPAQGINGQALGYLTSGNEGIERKPAERIVWRTLAQAEEVFVGDAVRTSSKSQGSVYLQATGTTLNLEPDSLIVLEENKDSFSIGLIEGGLSVKQDAQGTPPPKENVFEKFKKAVKKESASAVIAAPVIKAGKATVALDENKPADLNLTMDAQNSEVAISVNKGNIAVIQENKKIEVKEGTVGEIKKDGIDATGFIQPLTPRPGGKINIGPKGDRLIEFSWQPHQQQYPVRLRTGVKRESLSVIATAQNSSDTSLNTVLPAGSFFWQLVVLDPAGGRELTRSPIFRNEALAITAPTLVTPLEQEKFVSRNGAHDIPFSWTVSPLFDELSLIIARDGEFKQIIHESSVIQKSTLLHRIAEEGNYYCRLKARVSGSGEIILSQTRSFAVRKLRELSPPKPQKPQPEQQFMAYQFKKAGLLLEWQASEGAGSYQIELLKDGVAVKSADAVEVTEFKLGKVEAGSYKWRVRAAGPDQTMSGWSPYQTFKVIDLQTVAWQENQEVYSYDTAGPEFSLSWRMPPLAVNKWRVFYRLKAGYGGEKPLVKEAVTTTLRIPVAVDGNYECWVRGYDDKNNLSAESSKLVLTVQPIDELAPPALKAGDKKELIAARDGSIEVSWQGVAQAIGYLVTLVPEAPGKAGAFKKRVSRNSIAFKSLYPGRYTLKLATINKRNKVGAAGAPVSIVVKEETEVIKPKIKTINIR
jgi:hypothetical protein